jgi:hypothetical protein
MNSILTALAFLRKKENNKSKYKSSPGLHEYVQKYTGTDGKILFKRKSKSNELLIVSVNEIAQEYLGLNTLLNKDGKNCAQILEEIPTDAPKSLGVLKCK